MDLAPKQHSTFSRDLIERHLDHILTSASFCKSDRMRRLLRYLVENSITGRTERLKEYAIGVDVFDKDPSYDPRTDTNVRTEARRLRAKLAEYYESDGIADQLRINLPKGGYMLIFERREPELAALPAQGRQWRQTLPALIAGVVAVLAAAVWLDSRQKVQSPRSIAVLPFVDLSPDKSNEYFSDGLTEELTDALTRVDGLRVAARSSAFQFKGKATDVRDVGRRLNVNAVLEGSVRKAGNQLRITAQLNSAANGYHLWSRTWDRELNDVFSIQEEIAGAIAARLGTPVRARLGAGLVRSSTRNLEAYNLYLLGRYYWSKRNPVALNQAIAYFQRAVELDPDYAIAHGGLADAYNVLPVWSNTPAKASLQKAKEAAQRALSLDEESVEAHAALGYTLQHLEWNWDGAEREFRRVIELSRHYSAAHLFYSQWLRDRGRLDEAIVEMRRARESDPVSPSIKASGGILFYFARLYAEALKEGQEILQFDSGRVTPWRILGATHLQEGLYTEAIDDLQHGLRVENDSFCLGRLGYAYARAGRRGDALAVLERMLAEYSRSYISPYHIGVVYAGLGDIDQVFAWFEKAYEDRDPDLMMIKVEPLLDGLRADPRLNVLVRKMRLES
jgi:serine/threonine-protein kinase